MPHQAVVRPFMLFSAPHLTLGNVGRDRMASFPKCRGRARMTMLRSKPGSYVIWRGHSAFSAAVRRPAGCRKRRCLNPHCGVSADANGNKIYSYDDVVGSNVVLQAAAVEDEVSCPARENTAALEGI